MKKKIDIMIEIITRNFAQELQPTRYLYTFLSAFDNGRGLDIWVTSRFSTSSGVCNTNRSHNNSPMTRTPRTVSVFLEFLVNSP